MDEKVTVQALKEDLKALGAKTSGNKAVLQDRLNLWKQNKLDRQLVDATVVSLPNPIQDFPDIKQFSPASTIAKKLIEFLSIEEISSWFLRRSAGASLKKGRRLFLNKFVKNVMVCVESTFIFYRCVCAAQTKTANDYVVKVALDASREKICQATCECPAGAGWSAACKHISALSYFIEHFGITGEGIELTSCTSNPQEWHKPILGRGLQQEKVTVNEMLHLQVSADQPVPGDMRTDDFLNQMIASQTPVAALDTRIVNTEAYLIDHDGYCQHSIAVNIMNKINEVSPVTIQLYQVKTQSQAKSPLWFSIRETRITASIAFDVHRTVFNGNFCEGYAERQITSPKFSSKATDWGKDKEASAIAHYCKMLGSAINPCGIFIDPDKNWLAATPDGINDDKSLIIEVKCPYSIRFERPERAKFLKSKSSPWPELPSTHQYYIQCQIQMHVTRIKKCDFIVWTTHGIFIQNIKYDGQLCSAIIEDLELYYKTVFAPLCVRKKWHKR